MDQKEIYPHGDSSYFGYAKYFKNEEEFKLYVIQHIIKDMVSADRIKQDIEIIVDTECHVAVQYTYTDTESLCKDGLIVCPDFYRQNARKVFFITL